MGQIATLQRNPNDRKPLHIGDIRYVGGYTTKVEVVGDPDGDSPLCLVKERAPLSKFNVGIKYPISRKLLYPKQGR